MRNPTLPMLLLCTSLFVSAACADELSIPDNEQRQAMSYEEYAKHREEMRQRMEPSPNRDDRKQTQDSPVPTVDKSEKPREDSAYGKGYSARNRAVDKQDNTSRDRPERPEGRFSRDGMGRR